MKHNVRKIGLIGCGNMGSYFAYNISKRDDASLKLCCDPSKTKLLGFMKKWGVPGGTTEWREMFSQIDGIVNCTIDSLHEEIFRASLDAGVPLLTEKPLAVSFKTLKSFTPEKLANHQFVINFSKRSIPCVKSAKDFLEAGGLGRIHRMELHYRQGWVLNHDYGDWHDTSAWFWRLTEAFSNYGVLGDLGSHLFDLATWFCGPAKNLFCRTSRVEKGENEFKGHQLNSCDDAFCQIEMNNNASVMINMSRSVPGEKDSMKISISGEKGSLEIAPEENKGSYRLFLINTGKWETVESGEKVKRNLDLFLSDSEEETRRDFPGMKEAIYNQLLIEAAAHSAEKNCVIDIERFGEEQLEEIWQQLLSAQ